MKRTPFAQLCFEEPFRVFFPVGITLGFAGVLLWPLFFLGAISGYPSTAHARLMVEGFMSCFIFGFLGTAGPRVMSVPHLSGAEVARILLAVVAACMLHMLAQHVLGDALFLIALVLFAASLLTRFRRREDSPPPNFALVGLGILNGIVGAALLVFCAATGSAPSLQRVATSLLNVGFILLPLLGVAPFFLRRLLDLSADDDASAERQWARRAALAILTGLTIDASLVLEVYSSSSAIGWARFGVAALYVTTTLPMRGNSILAASLRLSLASIISGLALLAVLPAYRISALHVVFIGGFSLAIFSVATRVVLGHSGNLPLVRRRLGWLSLALALLLLAMVSRFVADFVPTRNEHLLWGAICWLAAAAIWALIVLPHVAAVEKEG